MDRGTYHFHTWCETATGLIRYGPDRKKVARELMTHLEDRRASLMEQGMEQQQASDKALEAMGSAEELAPQLAAIHKPFWGYVLRVSMILLVILLVICVKPLWDYTKNLDLQESPALWEFDVYSIESYGSDTGWTLLHLSQPDLSCSSDRSKFTITDAAVIKKENADDSKHDPYLHVRMEQTSLLPWTEHEQYFSYFFVSGWFSARDSLGNEYPGYYDRAYSDAPSLNTTGAQSGIFTYTHELWINNFPEDAQWVDICYERDGRSYALRVYLTGGDGA
mgnify:CR=1 FL=1